MMRQATRIAKKSPAYFLWLVLMVGGTTIGMFALIAPPSERVVVHFTPDSTLAERAAWLRHHETVLSLDALDTVVINTTRNLTTLMRDPVIILAEVDAPITLLQDDRYPYDPLSHQREAAPPPDPYYSEQWNIGAVGAPDAWMRLPQQHDITVAIIDSGICAAHPDFEEAHLSGYDFVNNDSVPEDTHGHGCGVAGIIGATRQNETGIAGLLNRPHLMSLRVADNAGAGYSSSVAAALVYATDHNADMINISLGTPVDTAILRRALAYTGDITVVAAAGSDSSPSYPAAYDSVIAAGSTNQAGRIVSTGKADRYAPGVDVLTTGLRDDIVQMSGTSVASAHITGMIALQMLTDGEMILDNVQHSQLVAASAPTFTAGARQVKVFTIIYRSSTPLYDPLTLNSLTLSDMTRSTIAHGYDNPDGQPALEFVMAADPVVVDGAPPPPDPNYDADYNYAAIYDNFDLCERIQQYEVDEVWIWGEANPAFGNGLEWVTNGPQLQWTWGSNVPDCGRTITTMWFEYNREVALALHSYGHRMEGAFMLRTPCQFMTATYPWAGVRWLQEQGRGDLCGDAISDETGFVARANSNNGQRSVCGDVHAPPNVPPERGEYLYSEPDVVTSICEDWQRDGTGIAETFGCERWNCNERDYHIWWKQNLPGIGYEHRDTDGTALPNWYEYLYDMPE